MRATHQRLKEKHIFTALRSDRDGRAYIRVSPHFYNTNDDLLRFLKALLDLWAARHSANIVAMPVMYTKAFVCLMLTRLIIDFLSSTRRS